MIYKLVEADPVLAGDAGPVPAEGTLLPETYLFTRGTTRARTARADGEGAEEIPGAALGQRAPPACRSRRREQAVILASIVEKETALPEERRHIAAVFVNRLQGWA